MHLNAFNAFKFLIKVRNLGDMLLNILQPQQPSMYVFANCLSIFFWLQSSAVLETVFFLPFYFFSDMVSFVSGFSLWNMNFFTR